MASKPKIKISYDENVQISLGERKYSSYMEALNETVRNSLDNKACRIEINVSNEKITIEDDGTGMDENSFNNDYFRIGKLNIDPSKGGLFGIGCLGHRALSNKTELTSHVLGKNRGIRIVVDWDKKKIVDTGWIQSLKEQHGTRITLTNLKYQPGKPLELRKYFERKYFPIFINPSSRLTIIVNGPKCRVIEPDYENKYEFDSTKDFVLGNKKVPAVTNANFGRVYGTFYIVDPNKDNTTYVYDRMGSQLNIYSQKDWLRIRSLTSGVAFQSRLLGIINTKTEEVIDKNLPEGKYLLIKSSRDGFFEGVFSFKELVEYLIGKPEKRLKLPHGGILRLIHTCWLEEYTGREDPKFRRVSDEEIKNIVPVLSELLKDEETIWKTVSDGEEKEKVRKRERGDRTKKPTPKPKHKRLQCPKCKAFNYITIVEYKIYVDNPNPEAKRKMSRNWPCKICGYYLNPDTDLHKIKSSPKKPGTVVAKVKIGKGTWVDVQHEGLGEMGDLGTCDISDEFLKINDQHAFYLQAYKLGTKMLDQHMIISALYAIAQAKKLELGVDFETEFNRMCANAHRLLKTKRKRK
ncbi:ATP-binding protein [candidate division WOR-3 bacterium]|nr:ATP-binding protein [candidate division WOR-3 bacterium]